MNPFVEILIGPNRDIVTVSLCDYYFVSGMGISKRPRAKERVTHAVVRSPVLYRGDLLHRLLLYIDDPKVSVSHINRNGLDNRRENLQLGKRIYQKDKQ